MRTTCLFLLLATSTRAQIPVTDPLVTGILATQKVNNDFYQTFMRLQIIQDAIMIKNNVLEAENYYTYISNCSTHRGGLLGYYRDMVTSQLQSLATQDQLALMSQATTVTGANAVDDFMGALSAGAVQAVQGAGNSANSALGGVVSGFNSGYNGLTGGVVANANNYVRAYQKSRVAVQQAQFARNAAISQNVAVAMSSSNANMALLNQGLASLEQQAAVGSITDQQFESIQTSMGSLLARIGIESYKMQNIQATLAKAALDEQTVNQAVLFQVQQDVSNYATQQGQQKEKYGHAPSDVTSELKRTP